MKETHMIVCTYQFYKKYFSLYTCNMLQVVTSITCSINYQYQYMCMCTCGTCRPHVYANTTQHSIEFSYLLQYQRKVQVLSTCTIYHLYMVYLFFKIVKSTCTVHVLKQYQYMYQNMYVCTTYYMYLYHTCTRVYCNVDQYVYQRYVCVCARTYIHVCTSTIIVISINFFAAYIILLILSRKVSLLLLRPTKHPKHQFLLRYKTFCSFVSDISDHNTELYNCSSINIILTLDTFETLHSTISSA